MSSFLPLIIIILIISIWLARRSKKSAANELYCQNCGRISIPKKITKGSFWIELVLWLCLIVPGFIYSIWRLTSRYTGCSLCTSANMIPVDSPKARRELSRGGEK